MAAVVALDKERMLRLLRRYLGDDETTWDPSFRRGVIDRLDVMVCIEPASIVARDQSYFASRTASTPG